MASPRWIRVARDLWLHKSRTLLVVVAIAVGIAGAGAVLDTWALLRRITREDYLATNPPAATIQVDAVDVRALAAVRATPGVRQADARRLVPGAVTTRAISATVMLFAGDELATSDLGRVAREEGAWPPPPGTLVAERSSVEYAGIAVGDSVTVRVGNGPEVRLPVVGIARDAGLAPGWMEHTVYGFVAPATLRQLGLEPALDQMRIAVAAGDAMDREAIRRVAAAVRASLVAVGREVRGVDVPVPGEHVHAAQMDSLLLTQGAFGVLALALSAFLVVNLMVAMLAGQVREVGIMKSLGARTGQLVAMYLVTALALGLLAAGIAIPLAAFAGRAYAAFAASLLNFSIDGHAIPPWSYSVQLGVAAVLPVAAALVPVARGCRISVADALRDVGFTASHDGGAGHILAGTRGVARPVLLAVRNAFRRRQRMALTLATLAMGGAVFIASLGLRSAIRGSVANLFDNLRRFDMSVRFASPHPADSLEAAVRAVPGVADAEAWNGVRAAVPHAAGVVGNSFALTGVPAATRLLAYPPTAGRWLRAGDHRAVVVTRRLVQDEPGLVPGAEIPLLIAGRESRWTVVGVVDAGPDIAAYATREAIAALRADASARVVVVRSAIRGAAAEFELLQRVRDPMDTRGAAVDSGLLVQAARAAFEDHLLMVAGFLVLMSQLTIVVGGLGLASTMSLGVLERTREIGVLRAVGAPHRVIALMVQGEGLLVTVMSWALAIPLSVPMSVAVARAFGRVMLPVPPQYVPEPFAVGAWLVLAVVVSALACAWPARRATRVSTRVALSYE